MKTRLAPWSPAFLTLAVFSSIGGFCLAQTPTPTPPPPDTEVFASNVDSAGTDLRWDRFQPAGAGPWPAVILLHVGGFKSGNRGPENVAVDLQAAGFMVFAAEYRLAPPAVEMIYALPPGNPQFNPPSDGRPPQQTDDVGAAITAARHDPHCNGRVIVVGGSSGGSHGVFAAAAFAGDSRPDIVVSLSGIYDFSDVTSLDEDSVYHRDPLFAQNCANYINFSSYLDAGYSAAAKAASPDYQANITTTRVPILFVSADADTIPKNQFDLLQSILTANSANFESIWRITGSNVGDPTEHAFCSWNKSTTLSTGPATVKDYVIDFLNRKLAEPPPPPAPTPSPTAMPEATPPPPQHLVNISTRVQVENGEAVMIGGFIIAGTGNKQVAIRALGPSLSTLGVTDTLADPALTLYDSKGTAIQTNDNWTSLPAGTVPANLQPVNAKESVIVATLPPGSYTAVLNGANGTTGNALCEVYDLGTPNATLQNISTRGVVGTGDSVMIGGLILSGTTSSQILVRALGPSLTAAGITGALSDPVLELHDSQGSLIFSNDNWRSSQEQQILATNLAPSDDRESAILATLPPAAYTAIVSGAGGATGIALIEVYSLN